MSVTNIRDAKSWFSVLQNGERCQTAVMTIGPGDSSGPKENEHPGSEQVVYIVEGELEAEVDDRRFTMRAGDSVIVKTQQPHRFSNQSSKPAVTFNVYVPPAY